LAALDATEKCPCNIVLEIPKLQGNEDFRTKAQ